MQGGNGFDPFAGGGASARASYIRPGSDMRNTTGISGYGGAFNPFAGGGASGRAAMIRPGTDMRNTTGINGPAEGIMGRQMDPVQLPSLLGQDSGMNPAMFSQAKPLAMQPPQGQVMGGDRGLVEGQTAPNGSVVGRGPDGRLMYMGPGYGMGPDTGNFLNDYRDGSGNFVPSTEGGINRINGRIFAGQGLNSGGIDFANIVRQYMPQYAGMFGQPQSMGSAQMPGNQLQRTGGTGIVGQFPNTNPYRLK